MILHLFWSRATWFDRNTLARWICFDDNRAVETALTHQSYLTNPSCQKFIFFRNFLVTKARSGQDSHRKSHENLMFRGSRARIQGPGRSMIEMTTWDMSPGHGGYAATSTHPQMGYTAWYSMVGFARHFWDDNH